MISHRYPVTGNRAGYGDTTIFHADAMLIEINAHHGLKTGIIQAGIRFGLRDFSTGDITQGKTRIRAAYISTKAYFVILLLLR
ncbi:Uncharacterised protein [Salmonella enterica subsp. enterica]|uniref:Uncharacterized protein n=1 Tax=Salmonella enterica I TaxID=59201 RepID=A0A379W5M9_SALET|nr:Uncharacterised protein [Salmonella enterica subsp. enterica]